jgi:gliding motility-associated-like protein
LKKIVLTYCLFLATFTTFAQKQTNTWYFGNRVGLDFNQTPPLPLTNGTANSQEGSAAISDNNGRLLFYSNGIVLHNRKHERMLNGNNLFGDLSSTNNVVIVPAPGQDSMYYVFTIGSAREEVPVFSYSVVDMKGDGGFGEVVQKNVFLSDTSLEKLAAVRHCNNRDVWIVIHKWKTDTYWAYLLTDAGVNPTPVISNTGLVITGQLNNTIGTLKFSPKGDKLVSAHSFDNDAIELMNFNNSTGVISNPVVFHPNSTIPRDPSSTGVYGAEFSPDGRLLYVSSNTSVAAPSVLYQFDITSHNAATIDLSKQVIAQTTPWFAGGLQIASDRKIYMAMWNDSALSVVENPNVYGPGCNFVFNKILMGPRNSTPVQFGLPTFMQSYFDTSSNPYDFNRIGNCLDRTVTFEINRLNGIDSVKWDFGDSQQSQALQPSNTYLNPGFYDVRLIVYKVDCSGLNDTITRRIWIADSPVFLGKDTSSCNVLTLNIGIDEISGVNYLWNTGANSSRITTTAIGTYWLELEQNGCKVRDSIIISLRPKPVVNIGPDTTTCANKQVILFANSIPGADYLWNTGETTRSIAINKTGVYYVTVTENSCVGSDTLVVYSGDCEVFIPGAFTPNGDGRNDKFGVVTDFLAKTYRMEIFNRYGQTIFESNDNTKKWDGTFKGKNMPNGAYLWIMNYTDSKGKKRYFQGTVLLIR